MRIGIVGSREYRHIDRVRLFVRDLGKEVTIVTGGTTGVATVAEDEASYMGMTVIMFDPRWDLHGRAAGPVSSELIVTECDELVAFWDSKSRGTLSSINVAKRIGKPYQIIGDGP